MHSDFLVCIVQYIYSFRLTDILWAGDLHNISVTSGQHEYIQRRNLEWGLRAQSKLRSDMYVQLYLPFVQDSPLPYIDM